MDVHLFNIKVPTYADYN